MKRFAILRDLPRDLTWEEVDSASIQNMIYMGIPDRDRALAWEPRILGVSWIRTYWEPGSNWGTCLCEAPDAQSVRDWHDLCEVSYAGIREVEVEESGESTGQYPRGFHELATAAPLLAVETESQTGKPSSEPGYRWIRTYRVPGTSEELRLYLPTGAANLDVPPVCGQVRRVVEIRPDDYQ